MFWDLTGKVPSFDQKEFIFTWVIFLQDCPLEPFFYKVHGSSLYLWLHEQAHRVALTVLVLELLDTAQTPVSTVHLVGDGDVTWR